MYISIILHYKIKIKTKLARLIKMGCLLSVYPEVIRFDVGLIKGLNLRATKNSGGCRISR